MRSFDELYAIAAERKGGSLALEALLEPPTADAELARLEDRVWLEQMTRCVFQAGFNWKVINNKWPGFVEAFKGFDVHACAYMDDAWFDALVADTRIVRNAAKIRTVPENAKFILDCAVEHGSFSAKIAAWPASNLIGLLDVLKKRGARLGGATGQYFLRFSGKDGFMLSRDVVARLMAENVIDKQPTSATAMRAVQAAFNTWAEQSSRPLKDISRVLAFSMD